MALTQISTQGIKDGTITNADINASAAIAGSKISPNFTSAMDVDGSITCDDIITAGALLHEGDTDTLVHFSAANTIELKTGGVSRLLVNNFGVSLNKDLNVNGNRIIVGDSSGSSDDRIVLGNNNDLSIFHNGTHSFMENSTGILAIRSDSFQITDKSNNHAMITAVADGAVELYYDNSKKLETTSTGVTVTGGITGTGGNFILGDSASASDDRLAIGAGGDLHVYHDGTNSYVSNATGDLNLFSVGGSADDVTIRAQDDIFLQPNNGAAGLTITGGGAIELYHNAAKKFETFSTGNKWHGFLFCDDNSSIRLGNGADLQIFHDGSNSKIVESGSGSLIIQTSNFNLDNADGTENILTATENGAVELYFDNSRKLRTRTAGVEVEGELGMADNYKIKLGTGEDLQIYHDGSNSYIKEVGTGNLNIQSDNTVEIEKANGTDIARFHPDGAVELFYNGTKKFETTNGGINITGSVACSGGASNNLSLPDNGKAKFGTGDDLQIYHDGTHSYIDNSTGVLFIRNTTATNAIYSRSDELLLQSYTGNENYLVATLNGGVELYHDNNKKFETVAGGVKTNDNNYMGFGNSNDLQISHDGSTNIINGLYHPIELRHQAEVHIKCVDDGGVELYHNNSKKFETNSDGALVAGGLNIMPGSSSFVTVNKEGTGILVSLRTTGTERGNISSNGSTVQFNTSSSDRSTKKNFEDWTENTLSLFKNINPQRFNFLDQEDGTDKEKGFIAQDLVTSFPEAYPKINDKYMFNPSAMVVYLMKAIQELETEVAALKAS